MHFYFELCVLLTTEKFLGSILDFLHSKWLCTYGCDWYCLHRVEYLFIVHDWEIQELLHGIQLFYIYWMYFNVTAMSKLHFHNVNERAFLNQEILLGVAKEFESCCLNNWWIPLHKNKKVKIAICWLLLAFLQIQFLYLALSFSFSAFVMCFWPIASLMQQKNLWACQTGQPLQSRVSPASMTTGHKQMGYHCRSCHLIQCQVQNW